MTRPFVLGIGGTTREGSSSERALRVALAAAGRAGAQTQLITARELELPMYAPERTERQPEAVRFLDALRRADGVLISSPGYHGGISGLLKNALDYVEDLRGEPDPYLHGRAVGCIVCAYGWQATTTTLTSLRSIVHALRGWPTPLGVAVNSSHARFAEDGAVSDPAVAGQLDAVGAQVVEFAHARLHTAAAA